MASINVEKLAKITVGKMLEIVRPLVNRIETLEATVAELSGNPAPKAAHSSGDFDSLKARIAELEKADQQREYKGTWEHTQKYSRHNMTTHEGSLWVAVRDPVGPPGQGESGWKLAAKRGRDAPR